MNPKTERRPLQLEVALAGVTAEADKLFSENSRLREQNDQLLDQVRRERDENARLRAALKLSRDTEQEGWERYHRERAKTPEMTPEQRARALALMQPRVA